MPKHPYVNKPRLVWSYEVAGVRTAYVERDAKWNKTSRQYTPRELLAAIRSLYQGDAILTTGETGQYVVTRNAFDEVRTFDDMDTAIVYVESLFALEYGS